MNGLSIVVAQKEAAIADRLAHTLRNHFRNVVVARSSQEIADAILKNRANAAVVDLELVDNRQLHDLCHEFNHTAVICTHRTPDDEMWTSSLEMGAADCCPRSDVDGVLRAIKQNAVLARAHAA